jgi:hypothetical protein
LFCVSLDCLCIMLAHEENDYFITINGFEWMR